MTETKKKKKTASTKQKKKSTRKKKKSSRSKASVDTESKAPQPSAATDTAHRKKHGDFERPAEHLAEGGPQPATRAAPATESAAPANNRPVAASDRRPAAFGEGLEDDAAGDDPVTTRSAGDNVDLIGSTDPGPGARDGNRGNSQGARSAPKAAGQSRQRGDRGSRSRPREAQRQDARSGRAPAAEGASRDSTPSAPEPAKKRGKRSRGRRKRDDGKAGEKRTDVAPSSQATSSVASPAHPVTLLDASEPPPAREAPPEQPAAERVPTGPPPKLGNGRTMIINAATGDECRVAVVFEKKLEEIFIERRSSASHVGNIYKGVVTNAEPSIQAAFIDFGLPKHGFLHISDVQPQYFGKPNAAPEGVGQKVPRRERPPIQKCFRRGQEVIVQVTKEGLGTKGPTLTTYLSIPGRFVVMMPGMTKLGVSRKIEDFETRRTMRELLAELSLPDDIGFIVRTAGAGRSKRDLQRDLNYLQRLWKLVAKRVRSLRAPAELYRESDLVTRTIRDVFTSDFDSILVDDKSAAARAREFLRVAMPRSSEDRVKLYQAPVPIFHHYGIEEQIEATHARHVPLKSGGSIVIDTTEAMVAIDVNSGRLRNVDGEEESALRTNLEAAQEIARQLRLRDLGGLVVCDFIDMRYDRNKRAVERALRDELKKHKERARLLRMSQFGLIELTRQRQGPSIKRGIYTDCPHCKGSGLVKTPQSMTLHVLRNVQIAAHREDLVRLVVTVSPEVAFELQNRKRATLHDLEQSSGKRIIVRADATYTWDQQDYEAEDTRGRLVKLYEEQSR